MLKRAAPPAPEAAAEVEDLAHDGRGVARPGGKVTFIAGALPGERVRFRLRRSLRSADEGELAAVERPSPDRVEPRCAHFGLCGGCTLQHLAPAAQAQQKQKQLLDALERIGRVVPDEVAPPVTGAPWGYRRRARLSVRHVPKKGGVLVGFRERDSPYVAQLQACEVLDPRVGRKLRELAACVERLDARTRVPQIEVAAVAGQVALVFRVMQPPTAGDLEVLRGFGDAHGFEIYLQTGGLDSVRPLRAEAPALAYTPDGTLALEFGPTDFIQVNDEVNRRMVAQALAWLAPRSGEAVLELFCGLGNFTLPLARAGAVVTAVEGDAALVERARSNAARNHLAVEAVRGDLFQPDPAAAWLRRRYAAVLLDPPRAGAAEILPHAIACGPGRLVYVSCHPGTLARDAAFLVGAGYRLRRAGILDMFPHTTHVESMALFERADGR